MRRPGFTLRLRDSALRGVHDFLAHKWYFDELYDAGVRAARPPRSAASAAP